jgi:hypothetical protein
VCSSDLKGGTTTLHEAIATHPAISLPHGKEQPFFTSEHDEAEWNRFVSLTYDGEKRGWLGKATPQYLNNPGSAEHIAHLFPNAKIIAILRDPAERTYSHYRMCLRRGLLSEDFEKHVDDWLEPDAIARARTLSHAPENEAACCVVWSEYSRLLKPYKKLFPSGSILILFTETLEAAPAGVYSQILAHIGAEEALNPEVTSKKFHVGGNSKKVQLPKFIKKLSLVRILTGAFFRSLPKQLAYRYMMWNVKASSESLGERFPDAKAKLDAHFGREAERLTAEFGVDAPW